jgi:hypothetical protein
LARRRRALWALTYRSETIRSSSSSPLTSHPSTLAPSLPGGAPLRRSSADPSSSLPISPLSPSSPPLNLSLALRKNLKPVLLLAPPAK